MGWLSSMFGFKSERERLNDAYHCALQWREMLREQYAAMRDAMDRETPEQKARFYLEVAALLGNRSAAERLRDFPHRSKDAG